MDFKKVIFRITVVTLVFFCLGFRVYPGKKRWPIETSSTAARKVFISNLAAVQNLENNLPSGDPLSSSGSTLSTTQLLDSIISDYNSIQSSILILVLDTDPDFALHSANRRIKIQDGSAAGFSSGEARVNTVENAIVSCEINLTSVAYRDAKTFVSLLTHELGHCMGLDHPQDTENAVMSYFHSDEVYRLAIDDKMGLVHLYATDPSYSNEKPNLGLSCNRQE
jgi:Matrixin